MKCRNVVPLMVRPYYQDLGAAKSPEGFPPGPCALAATALAGELLSSVMHQILASCDGGLNFLSLCTVCFECNDTRTISD
jgi:hypothetical protein